MSVCLLQRVEWATTTGNSPPAGTTQPSPAYPPIRLSQFAAKQYINPALPLILSWSTLQPRVPCEEFHDALATGSGLVPLWSW
jgi:hypothetical protein